MKFTELTNIPVEVKKVVKSRELFEDYLQSVVIAGGSEVSISVEMVGANSDKYKLTATSNAAQSGEYVIQLGKRMGFISERMQRPCSAA